MGRVGAQGGGSARAGEGWGVAAWSSRLWWARVCPWLTCSGGTVRGSQPGPSLVPPPTLSGATHPPTPPPLSSHALTPSCATQCLPSSLLSSPPTLPPPCASAPPLPPSPSSRCHRGPRHPWSSSVLWSWGAQQGGVRPCSGHRKHGSASGDGMARTPRMGPPTAISAGTNCQQPSRAVPGTRGGQ